MAVVSESEQGFDAQVRGLLTAIEKLVADLAPATRELVEQYRKHPPGRNAQSRQQQAAGRFAFPLCYGDLLRQQKDELTPEQAREYLGLLTEFVNRLQPSATADGYDVHTSQETSALFRAVSRGHGEEGWKADERAGEVYFDDAQSKHAVVVKRTAAELDLGVDPLWELVHKMDADCTFAFMYIAAVLLKQDGAEAWLDLNDIAEKIGMTRREVKNREEQRRKVWTFLQFGERAWVRGARSVPYHEKGTRNRIDTRIDARLWAVMSVERPAQGALWTAAEIPVRASVSLSREWRARLSNPQLAQYLPMGELLGAIKARQPSGAWARVIGLALAEFWRRHPREALDGALQPTRRELLERYPAKVAPYTQILASDTPHRALTYWRQALRVLVGEGFLADEGEAKKPAEPAKRQGWQEAWLDQIVSLLPGPKMRESVEACARARPVKALPASGEAQRSRRKKATV